jgi:hypothetical protein
MDRDEALKLLRGGPDGVAEWNRRREVGEGIPELRLAKLSGADLSGAYLREADLFKANLSRAYLTEANLSRANLSRANLSLADLRAANLSAANLSAANLNLANLAKTNLLGANLIGANLIAASFSGASLSGTDLNTACCWWTLFADVDLSEAKSLGSVTHDGPSTVGIDTLLRSNGDIPEAFLRGCGLSPWEVLSAELYKRELTPPGLADLQSQIFDAWTKGRSMLNGCFLSYSWKDAAFVEQLRDRLMSEGINVWLDRHDMVAGTIQDQVWRAIQIHHVVILVLSNDSVESDWVENELDMARKKEKDERRAVLCPIALDDAWKDKAGTNDGPGDPSRQLWRTLTQKLVLDFSEKTEAFDVVFQKLVRGLNANYGPR